MSIIDNENILLVANDNSLEVNGLRNAVSGNYINDALVVVVGKNEDGTEITGQTWPLTLSYVAASQGSYRAILKDTLNIKHGQHYRIQVAIQGDGLKANWEAVIQAKLRRK